MFERFCCLINKISELNELKTITMSCFLSLVLNEDDAQVSFTLSLQFVQKTKLNKHIPLKCARCRFLK